MWQASRGSFSDAALAAQRNDGRLVVFDIKIATTGGFCTETERPAPCSEAFHSRSPAKTTIPRRPNVLEKSWRGAPHNSVLSAISASGRPTNIQSYRADVDPTTGAPITVNERVDIVSFGIPGRDELFEQCRQAWAR
jgi:hypothetical protein